MIINVHLNPDNLKALIEAKGHKVIQHNFATQEKSYHGKIELMENIKPAVKMAGMYFRLDAAYKILYSEVLMASDMAPIINAKKL